MSVPTPSPSSSTSSPLPPPTVTALIEKLCDSLLPPTLTADARLKLIQYSLRILSSRIAVNPVASFALQHQDLSTATAEQIKKRLFKANRTDDALKFAELHRRLNQSSVLSQKTAVVFFLDAVKSLAGPSSASASASSPPVDPEQQILQVSSNSVLLSAKGLPIVPVPTSDAISSALLPSLSHASSLSSQTLSLNAVAQSAAQSNKDAIERAKAARVEQARLLQNIGFGGLTEQVLLHDVIFAFQGIDGKFIKWNATLDRFTVDDRLTLSPPVHELVLKLVDLGWLFSKTQEFVQFVNAAPGSRGLQVQAFCAALHQELVEFYKLMAILDGYLEQSEAGGAPSFAASLTLRKLAVWTFDPIDRMRILAALVDVCGGLKGGALVSAIHSFLRHGDPAVQRLVQGILGRVLTPLYTMLHRWLYDGEIDDPHAEYFIAMNANVPNDQVWTSRFVLRESMLVTTIEPELARKILLIGKSINFLRQSANDKQTISELRELKQRQPIFTFEEHDKLVAAVNFLYNLTSDKMKSVIVKQHRFLEHMSGIRKYLLFGQGDFAQQLMDLIHDELLKPAVTLYSHNLSSILESAIRSTNAQYESNDVLNRLSVKLLEASPGDSGWDVFTLEYHIGHPLDIILGPAVMAKYVRLFHFLWKLRRIDFNLSIVWKEQIVDCKQYRAMSELDPLLHLMRIVSREMIYFVRQFQYHLLYEILECCWVDLRQDIQQSRDVDELIQAHDKFLSSILSGALLSGDMQAGFARLKTLLDLVLRFKSVHSQLIQSVEKEHARRVNLQLLAAQRTKAGKWGLTEADTQQDELEKSRFESLVLDKTLLDVRELHGLFKSSVQGLRHVEGLPLDLGQG